MHKNLIKEREAFLKRALANPSIEIKKRVEKPPVKSEQPPKKKIKLVSTGPPDITSYKNVTGGSNFKFGVLTRIVRHMKTRHQDGEIHPLSIEEILDETNQLNVGQRVKQWLTTESLPNNPKIQEVDGKYLFKPPLPTRDKKSLFKLLRQHDMKGLGGIMFEDIQESVPHHEKVMKHIDKEILRIVRQTDKKPIIFYHDKSIKFEIDKEFQQLWRNAAVDGLQDDNIDEYLTKVGIKSMQDTGHKALIPIRKRNKARKQRPAKISDNEHIGDILKNYDNT